jgi:sulfur carrier protein ThiS adenylyltransferase
MKVVAVVGPSGTGKTSLIEQLVAELKRRGLSAAVIKHCSRGFSLDQPGKDSRRFKDAGADGVALVSPAEVAIVRKRTREAEDLLLATAHFEDMDIVFIEGRHAAETTPIEELMAVVSDFDVELTRPVFRYGQIHEIADFLEKEAQLGMDRQGFQSRFFSKHDLHILPILQSSTVGIAGAGGLGSNAAVSLARAGLGKLIIADFDRVEPSDLNRQYYFREQVGKLKVEALLENLMRISTYSRYEIHPVKIQAGNVATIFGTVDVLVEALDQADMKQMLVNSWLSLYPQKPIIVASGLAGIGKNEKIHSRKMGNLYICGDEETESGESISPMAPRVGIVANMQANLALELLVRSKGKNSKT